EVLVVDPTKHRLGAIRNLGGSLVAWEVTSDRIVALLAPLDGIGASKLAVIDDHGGVRTAPLPQIRAGTQARDNNAIYTFEWPALAVDKTRAVVVGVDGAAAEIRLDTLAVTSREIRSLAAVRKEASGSMRAARFVDANIVAVSGDDWSWDGTMQRITPAGLTLVDTRDWSLRNVDSVTRGLAPSGFGPVCTVCRAPLP